MSFPFFTIGHSTRPVEEFIALLTASSRPRGRCARFSGFADESQYSREPLAEFLAGYQIAYEHIAALGGRRPRAPDISPSVNGFWQNQSFHNYADYAMGGGFRCGLARLRQLSRLQPCAMMCAETVWWRCHRRIIADYLLLSGERVLHILGPDAVFPASLTRVATLQPDGALTYPAQSGELG